MNERVYECEVSADFTVYFKAKVYRDANDRSRPTEEEFLDAAEDQVWDEVKKLDMADPQIDIVDPGNPRAIKLVKANKKAT